MLMKTDMLKMCSFCSVLVVSALWKVLKTCPVLIPNIGTLLSRTRTFSYLLREVTSLSHSNVAYANASQSQLHLLRAPAAPSVPAWESRTGHRWVCRCSDQNKKSSNSKTKKRESILL